MKRAFFLSLLVASLSAVQVLAQGTVHTAATSMSTYVRNPDGTLVSSSQDYHGELMYAPDGAGDFFYSVAVRLGRDFLVGVPGPGAFASGTRTAPTPTPGAFGLFQVRLWRASDGPDWAAVMATKDRNFLVAETPIMRVETGDPTLVPPDTPGRVLIPPGSLTLHPVPEPSTIALALLTVGALFIWRRTIP